MLESSRLLTRSICFIILIVAKKSLSSFSFQAQLIDGVNFVESSRQCDCLVGTYMVKRKMWWNDFIGIVKYRNQF